MAEKALTAVIQEAYIGGISARLVAVIIAVDVNDDGRREVLGLKIGASEAETFWSSSCASWSRRGLRGWSWLVPRYGTRSDTVRTRQNRLFARA